MRRALSLSSAALVASRGARALSMAGAPGVSLLGQDAAIALDEDLMATPGAAAAWGQNVRERRRDDRARAGRAIVRDAGRRIRTRARARRETWMVRRRVANDAADVPRRPPSGRARRARRAGFSVDQLMELAGLSVACAVVDAYPAATSCLVVAGPGNNGGDGLVAARHLVHFGLSNVVVVYPKRPEKSLFANLVKQCEDVGAAVSSELVPGEHDLGGYDVVLDAIFGFSFRGVPRAPFDAILAALERPSRPPLVSVDVPSGWHVEDGPTGPAKLAPDVLVSLTAPKRCARHFAGRHYVGGRFVPPTIKAKSLRRAASALTNRGGAAAVPRGGAVETGRGGAAAATTRVWHRRAPQVRARAAAVSRGEPGDGAGGVG